MRDLDKIMQAIFEAIDEVNEQLPMEGQLEKSTETVLFGEKGRLDSLGLVSLVTTVEQKIEEKFGMTTALLENIDPQETDNPFRTVKVFSEYIASILEK